MIELDAVAGNRDEEEKEKWNGRKKTKNGTSIGTKAKIRVQRIAFPPQLFTHADRMCTKEGRQRAKNERERENEERIDRVKIVIFIVYCRRCVRYSRWPIGDC